MPIHVFALIMGLVSAASLPFGALTSMFWRPGDRTIGGLMAFGGGALLAALSIDLVAETVFHHPERYWALVLGCIAGAVLFQVLNQIVNKKGGFLRKTSTTLFYLQTMNKKRVADALGSMGRIDAFHGLDRDELQTLASHTDQVTFRRGHCLYEIGDPSHYLYLILDGHVELYESEVPDKAHRSLGRQNATGRMAFFTAMPHGTKAMATEDTVVLRLRRSDLCEHLEELPQLCGALETFLRTEKVATYLRDRHAWSEEQVEEFQVEPLIRMRSAAARLAAPDPELVEEFLADSQKAKRFGFFRYLDEDTLELLATRVFRMKVRRGYTFFAKGEASDRMFLLDRGSVDIVASKKGTRDVERLEVADAFGGMAFLSGASHSATAIAAQESEVWVLKREDFDQLLTTSAPLMSAVAGYIKEHGETEEYLRSQQNLDRDKIDRWTNRAIRCLNEKRPLPHARDLQTQSAIGMHGAPLAIWLGIMLDGVPESIVIGTNLLETGIPSLSLIGGVFIANYPEALSSSVGMRHQGYSKAKIFILWMALMIMTGAGAMIGAAFLGDLPPYAFAAIEGVAAGAMLAMIAETMLPEAYFRGGEIVGFATLGGFLTAISLRVFG